ncbi:MAG: type II CAAX endopeptidase family protein [Anaerolineales bacterium]|jgi:membrane protease YdiL (CAAX protease family)
MTDLTDDTQPTEPASIPPQPIWNGWDLIWITFGILFSLIVGTLVIGSLLRITGHFHLQSPGSATTLSVASAALEGMAFIGSVYFLGLRRRHHSWQAVKLRPPDKTWWQYALVIGLLVIPISGLIASLIQRVLGLPETNPQLPFIAPEGFSWFGAIGMFLFGGIIAPFAEELVFRGVLYQWLRDRYGLWPGILISSLIFGLAHGDIAIGGAAAVLGIVLAWTFEKSQSLWPSVLIHVINNGAKIVLLYGMLAAGIKIS